MFNTTIKDLSTRADVANTEIKLFMLLIIETVSLFGNLFFIIAIFYRRATTKRSKTYHYLAYVSFTNIGVAIFVIPFPIVTLVRGEWVLGEQMCYFNAMMNSFWLTSCVFSITVLSVHKYFSIVMPLKRNSTTRQVIYRISSSLLLSFFISLVPFFNLNVSFRPVIGLCIIDFTSNKFVYIPFVMTFIYIIPMTINIVCHVRIYISLHKHDQRMRNNSFNHAEILRSQKKLINTLHIVFLSFVFSWTPFFIYSVLYLIKDGSHELDDFLVFAYIAGFSNSSQNPVIFIIRNVRIKDTWASIFRRKIPPKLSLVSTLSRSNLYYDDRRTSLFFLTPPENDGETFGNVEQEMFAARYSSFHSEEIRFESYSCSYLN